MFRRLALPVGLTYLGTLLGLALALTAALPGEARAAALQTLLAVGAAGAAALSVVCRAQAARLARRLRDLAQAADHVGGGDGPPRHVAFSDRDEVGDLGRTFNAMHDRLAARIARLEEDRQQLRTILGGMVEGVVALDAEQRIVFANDRALPLLEMTTPAPVGRRLWEVVRQRPLLDVVQRALLRAEPSREEIVWAGGTGRSLAVHAARLPGAPPRGVVLVVHDTSDLRRLERLRQEFVANVSHELKTPLAVIKACVETLLLGGVEDAQNRGLFLDRISEQSDRLYALILDLLSLARIEAGEGLFDFRAVEVGDAAAACLERHRPRADARQQTLTLTPGRLSPLAPATAPANGHAGGADEATVWADEEALGQILDNLVDNAVKYTPVGGQIRVGWAVEDGQVVLEVADDGIGIPEGDLARIFERFYRVDKARSRELGGTGLGLAIVKHLVGALHGTVRASSRPGAGTSFVVCLPRAGPE